MSNPTRKSGFAKNRRKNTKNSPSPNKPLPSPHNSPKNSLRNKGFKPQRSTQANHQNWIWGTHAVKAALENPRRSKNQLLLSPKAAQKLALDEQELPPSLKIRQTHPGEIDGLLPDGAVHQGAALSCAPLACADLDDICREAKGLILVLDQITDPHNVGAMFRLAAAFNAKGIIMQSRHAPPLMGATAKVAVGTVESVPHVLVTNIANTLLALQDKGWRVTGLAGEAKIDLQQAFRNAEAEVIVMGAEGPGLRKRVRDCCDQLAKIPMPGHAESLNVSTATGIALYEAVRNTGPGN